MFTNPPFPIHAFPAAVENAAHEVQVNIGAPLEIVGAALLSSMSLATQLLHDVRMPHGQLRPTVLSQLVIAESGDRKSSVQKCVLRPFFEFDAHLTRDEVSRARNRSEHKIWEQKCRHLERKISKLEIANADAEAERAWLNELLRQAPGEAGSRRLIFENMSAAALYEALQGQSKSIAILSDEAEAVYSSHLFNTSSLLNKGWDSSEVLTLDRARGEAIVSRNPRVSSFLMIQPDIWTKVLSKRGQTLRASGYLARMLPVLASSLQGYRSPTPEAPSWVYLDAFHKEMEKKLHVYEAKLRSSGEVSHISLEFDFHAKNRLRDLSQGLEQHIAPGMPLFDTKDFASKAIENICRVAACLHCFSDYGGEVIGEEMVARAAGIVFWHGDQFKLIFSPNGPLSSLEKKAGTLLSFLRLNYWNLNKCASLGEALRMGPVRPKESFDACVGHLMSTQRAQLVRDHTGTKTLIAPGHSTHVGLI